MTNESIARVRQLLEEHEARYKASAHRWKLGHRTLLITAAVSSSAAAVVGKFGVFGFSGQTDIAAALAAIAALLAMLVASLDFEANARINRRFRHRVAALRLEAEKSTASGDALLSQLQAIVRERADALTRHVGRDAC